MAVAADVQPVSTLLQADLSVEKQSEDALQAVAEKSISGLLCVGSDDGIHRNIPENRMIQV